MKKSLKRLISIILAAAMVFCMMPAINGMTDGAVGTYTASAYTNHNQAEAVEWIKARKSEGWAQNYDGKGGSTPQCVDLIVYYFDYLTGDHLSGSGYQYVGRTDLPEGWVYTSTPEPGDIAAWGQYQGFAKEDGHVALVEAVNNANSTFDYVDVNGATGKAGSGTTSFTNPSTFIHPDFKCKEHSWGKAVVTKKAVHTKKKLVDGEKTYTCTVCGETKTEVIRAAHSYSVKSIKKATSKSNGYIKKTCTNKKCGKKIKETIYKASKAEIAATVTYTGKKLKPRVVVKDSKGKVIAKKNYSVSYKNNKKVGQASVTIKFKGKYYSGTRGVPFKIVPKGTTITKLNSKANAIQVVLKQIGGVSGYQIRYAKSAGMSGAKRIKTKKNKEVVTKLSSGTVYYFQIRTYKKVGKKYYYSGWSDTIAGSTTTDEEDEGETGDLVVEDIIDQQIPNTTTGVLKFKSSAVNGASKYEFRVYTPAKAKLNPNYVTMYADASSRTTTDKCQVSSGDTVKVKVRAVKSDGSTTGWSKTRSYTVKY